MLKLSEIYKLTLESIQTLYHGSKKGQLDNVEFNDNMQRPYFYLTDDKNYAKYYARNNPERLNIFEVDINNLLDLRSLGLKNYSITELQKIIYKKTKLHFPPELAQIYGINNAKLWQFFRGDSVGYIKRRLQSKYDGVIFQEDGSDYNSGIGKNAYVLFNSNPIKKKLGM